MKRLYELPKIEIVDFTEENISTDVTIITSGTGGATTWGIENPNDPIE